jgi:thiamine-monophosphate kinase
VHFPEDAPAQAVGHKALAVNLSDLAAMGAEPVGALLSLTVPAFDADWLEGFCRGFGELARIHGVSLMGGDTTSGPLAIAVQVVGTVLPGQALRRDGARPGGVILVSGTRGDAAVGLGAWQRRHDDGGQQQAALIERLHYPRPRIELGLLLAGRAHACIDISDGLVADLGHVLKASAVGANLDVDAVPVSEAYAAACPESFRRQYALAWGDDYELCACIAPELVDEVVAAASAAGVALTPVGTNTAGRGLALTDAAGRAVSIDNGGYRHFGDGQRT